MKIVAIISEYNPFHNGHKYHIEKIREELGKDTAIIAIMSGSFTQRGELAVADKVSRAKCALLCGVNLVLELPFPFSMSSAELFAASGVRIATSLGVVDHLSFGSESGDVNKLSAIAENMLSEKFREELSLLLKNSDNAQLGYAALSERAYETCFGSVEFEKTYTPNNILAIEYLKALKLENSTVKPHTVKRIGAGYNDGLTDGTTLQSASAIRHIISDGDISALEYVPDCTKNVYLELIKEGYFPSCESKLSEAVISFLRLNPALSDNIFDAQGGLYNRLRDKSFETTSISSLVSLSATKKYTVARIRRALWNSFFGVTSSEIKELPKYTQLLAADNIGVEILKSIKKVSDFPVITKPSSYTELSCEIVKQKELSVRAESVWTLSLPKSLSGRFPLKFTPFVKK